MFAVSKARPQKALLRELCEAYELNASRALEFAAYANAILEIGIAAGAKMKANVNQQPTRLKEFLSFLQLQPDLLRRQEVLDLLLKANAAFERQWWKMPCRCADLKCDLTFWRSLLHVCAENPNRLAAAKALVQQDDASLCSMFAVYNSHANRDRVRTILDCAHTMLTVRAMAARDVADVMADTPLAPRVFKTIALIPLANVSRDSGPGVRGITSTATLTSAGIFSNTFAESPKSRSTNSARSGYRSPIRKSAPCGGAL